MQHGLGYWQKMVVKLEVLKMGQQCLMSWRAVAMIELLRRSKKGEIDDVQQNVKWFPVFWNRKQNRTKDLMAFITDRS